MLGDLIQQNVSPEFETLAKTYQEDPFSGFFIKDETAPSEKIELVHVCSAEGQQIIRDRREEGELGDTELPTTLSSTDAIQHLIHAHIYMAVEKNRGLVIAEYTKLVDSELLERAAAALAVTTPATPKAKKGKEVQKGKAHEGQSNESTPKRPRLISRTRRRNGSAGKSCQPKLRHRRSSGRNHDQKENTLKASRNSEPMKTVKKMSGKSNGSMKPASSTTESTKDKEPSNQGQLEAPSSKGEPAKPSKDMAGKSTPLKLGSSSTGSSNNKQSPKKGEPLPQAPGGAKKMETPTVSKSRRVQSGRARKEDEAKVKKEPIQPRNSYERLEKEMKELYKRIKNTVSELQMSGEKTLSNNPKNRLQQMSKAKRKAEAFLKTY